MSRAQREKGKRFERRVASEFRDAGFDARRLIQSRGAEGADVAVKITHPLFSGLWVECKHRAQPNIREALEQAREDEQATRDTSTGFRCPVAVTLANGGEPLATMTLADFLSLVSRQKNNP